MYCEDPSDCESAIHQEFDYCRVSNSREFFRLDTKKAVGTITQHLLHQDFGLCVVDEDCYIPETGFDYLATDSELDELWMVNQEMRFFSKEEWLTACARAADHYSRKNDVQAETKTTEAEAS